MSCNTRLIVRQPRPCARTMFSTPPCWAWQSSLSWLVLRATGRVSLGCWRCPGGQGAANVVVIGGASHASIRATRIEATCSHLTHAFAGLPPLWPLYAFCSAECADKGNYGPRFHASTCDQATACGRGATCRTIVSNRSPPHHAQGDVTGD